ncbi:hypothetical protein [Phytomonospora endophytica]|uniref:Uncharacterized protein n=1 Tax=Phytomonospora endophytica TaxID=714109 RepID=A0A841FFA0_9ACTN|nr:hypothetical protein [Phytomonospora endophytica]MBB6034946.1 hypothetical protein [Phytomonospora endophytica]GIG70648.1 hypothetical protein Pen01_69430 [Phytomonospora endophytica]
MSHLARRVLSTAAAVTLLGIGLAGCGSAGSDTGSGSGTGADTPAEDSPSLDCTDLKEQVDDAAPSATASFDEFDPTKFLALADWAAENGKDFEDPDLGTRVTEWGEDTPKIEEHQKALEAGDDKALDELEADGVDNAKIDSYEANSNKIDEACPGIGFGVLPE